MGALLKASDSRDVGRKLLRLLCFLTVLNVWLELFLLASWMAACSSPTVAWRKSSQNVHSPSLKSAAIFFPVLKRAS
jgi:hypothetical protein